MKKTTVLGIVAALGVAAAQLAEATSPTPAEMSEAHRWAAARFDAARGAQAVQPPFSFTYDGKASAELLKTWELKRAGRPLDAERTEHVLTLADPRTGLMVHCVGVEYRDFPAVEWVISFKNSGDKDTPIIADIRALDSGVPIARDKQAVVHYALGSQCRADDFAPQLARLGPDANAPQGPWVGEGNCVRLQSQEGRSSCGMLPFFNVDAGGARRDMRHWLDRRLDGERFSNRRRSQDAGGDGAHASEAAARRGNSLAPDRAPVLGRGAQCMGTTCGVGSSWPIIRRGRATSRPECP